MEITPTNMNIVAISDLHGLLPENVPDGDVLVIAGDLCPWEKSHAYWSQYKWMTTKLFPWLERIQSVEQIIFIGGNHDFVLDPEPRKYHEYTSNPAYRKILEAINNLSPHIHYLRDSGLTIDGVKFWGTPYVPEFFGWAFMEVDSDLHLRYDNIPEDTDVLISHGPPYGFGDVATDFGSIEHVGSYALSSALSKRPNIKLNFFGHIHGGWGVHHDNDHGISHHMWEDKIQASMMNVACRNDYYDLRPAEDWFAMGWVSTKETTDAS